MLLDHVRRPAALAVLLGLSFVPAAPAPGAETVTKDHLPPHLPHYRVHVDLDVKGHTAHVRQEATWINPSPTPTRQLVFNAHSRYAVPDNDVGLMAKTLEILRVAAGESLGYKDPPLEVHKITLASPPSGPAKAGVSPVAHAPGSRGEVELPFHYEGDTKTDLVVPLPCPIGQGESVTVVLDLTLHLPPKQGRWGQWDGVTFLSNWLPVFAYYGEPMPRADGPLARGAPVPGPRVVRAGAGQSEADTSAHPAQRAPGFIPGVCQEGCGWQPTPFIAWHQPFFNEAGHYAVTVVLPAGQEVACTGAIKCVTPLPGGKQQLDIQAVGVREFTLLCSHRYRVVEGVARAGPGGAPVRVRVLAFPEHAFYAKHMVRIAIESLETYCRWLGPYPWPEFTVAEAFFGWNGNECSTLVMIDQRVFAMPHVAVGYIEYLLSHEVCHQWWYNLVGTNGYCETWMDEAMANHFSHRLQNEKLGRNNNLMNYPAWLEWLPNIRRDDYRSSGLFGTLGRGELTPVLQEMPKFGHLVNLFNLCYDKGGRIVGMIEQRLGSAAFLDFSRRVVARYRFGILRVADYRRELEQYTGYSWEEFFRNWLCESGMSDWSVEKVSVTKPPKCLEDRPHCCILRRKLLLCRGSRPDDPWAGQPGGEAYSPPPPLPTPLLGTRVKVVLHQKAENDEPTVLGLALPDCQGYPIRIPILPHGRPYTIDEPPATVTPLPPGKKGGTRLEVEMVLPVEPTQVAVDPDQVLADADPANNYWHTPLRWRVTPLYTFLEETDLTAAYDRWNVNLGPWVFTAPYQDAWFTRSTMAGLRAGVYRTQQFVGGAYVGYRTDYRDVVAGLDAMVDHWPFCRSQVGLIVERRLAEVNEGEDTAKRAVLWGRYIFTYGSSLYLPPIHYLEAFAHYSDNFLPFPTQRVASGVRYDRTSTLGLHYRINYLTPYWDPEGGFHLEAWYEGGIAQQPSTVGLHKLASQFSIVKGMPGLGEHVEDWPVVGKTLDWLSSTRVALRAYGATATPTKGEFFSMGGSELFRGFDLAQRQGSSVWVGSIEWRVPLAQRMQVDAVDHVIGLRNAWAALFYDVGNAYTSGQQVGPIAHGVGLGLRLDVAWFSFVERTTLRVDVAKSVNTDTGVQVWLGINHPF